MDSAVSIFLYGLYFSGIFLVFRKSVHVLVRRIQLRHRLNLTLKDEKKKPYFIDYINKILSTSFHEPRIRMIFKGSELILFFTVFVIAYRNFTASSSFVIAGMIASLPFMMLAVRVESDRNRGSREGISLISELYRQYRISGKNMLTALEQTLAVKDSFPVCGRYLYRLLLKLRTESGSSGLRSCIDDFTFSLGTVWGRMLGLCIRLSVENGTDVSEGLADIALQLKNAASLAEDRKRMNSESSRITLILVPLLYAASMIAGHCYLDVSFRQLLHNQFFTPEGFILFVCIVFLFAFNTVVLHIISSVRMDY